MKTIFRFAVGAALAATAPGSTLASRLNECRVGIHMGEKRAPAGERKGRQTGTTIDIYK